MLDRCPNSSILPGGMPYADPPYAGMEAGLPRPNTEGSVKVCELGMDGRGSEMRDGEACELG